MTEVSRSGNWDPWLVQRFLGGQSPANSAPSPVAQPTAPAVNYDPLFKGQFAAYPSTKKRPKERG